MATRNRVRGRNDYQSLATYLSMDFAMLVLVRFNRGTGRYCCVWADGPTVREMERHAVARYVSALAGVDFARIDWIISEALLMALNQREGKRPTTWHVDEFSDAVQYKVMNKCKR